MSSRLSLLPNLLSLSRIPLAVLMAIAVWQSSWFVAAVILWIAIATDVADGKLARRLEATSNVGGLMDHGSDAFFVTLTLAALAISHQIVPLLLPVVIPIAFAQYVFDSRALIGKPLRASRLGRYNGICYFVLAGYPVMQHVLDLYLMTDELIHYVGWGLVLTTFISMLDRLTALLRGVRE